MANKGLLLLLLHYTLLKFYVLSVFCESKCCILRIDCGKLKKSLWLLCKLYLVITHLPVAKREPSLGAVPWITVEFNWRPLPSAARVRRVRELEVFVGHVAVDIMKHYGNSPAGLYQVNIFQTGEPRGFFAMVIRVTPWHCLPLQHPISKDKTIAICKLLY